ncbi:hypothetical protein CIB95_04965 [Lottiidibacillus patelloidae]|uniref:DUF4181 domain-containing protein n=1 Tax=Lottiidibacillus patelloidae TaxID=2670334 RepID=A0A263BVH2_9BACI|nr:hypothetical protein CIB95_04965 [Lottiidibacillus patelloidae]
MSEEKNKLYLNMVFGYIGIFLLSIAALRYILITEDAVGLFLITFSVICLQVFFRYVESKLLSNKKEKLVFNSFFYFGIIIIFIIGFLLIQNS